MRIGIGTDVHAFAPGDFLMLAGVRVPHERGVKAHSDGDVVLHALCDALLGAAGLGDIGEHFPDAEAHWANLASSHFVAQVMRMLRQRGLRVGNVDITVIAEQPRIAPHRAAMRASVAELLGVPRELVNIKAKTTERLGFLGRAEGIAADAAVLLLEPLDGAAPSA